MKGNGNRYSPAFKFRVVLEALKAEGKGAEAQVARAYGVHPVTLAKWKRHFLEHGAEVFGEKMVTRYASRVTGFKGELTLEKKLALVERHREEHGLNHLCQGAGWGEPSQPSACRPFCTVVERGR